MAIIGYRSPHDSPLAARDPDGGMLVDLSEIAVAPALIVFVDVDALQPFERAVIRVLDALGHARAHVVLYTRQPSADNVRLRVELPRASWLNRTSAVGPGDLLTMLTRGLVGARVLAIGVRPDLRRALADGDAILPVEPATAANDDDSGYRRIVLCSTLWALVKLRYRIRESLAE